MTRQLTSSSIPLIETDRLRLRGHTLDDFPACATLWSNPDVTRFTTGRPQSSEESWARLLRYVGHWTLLGYGFWLVEEKTTGVFVGEIGFANFKREMTPSLGDALDTEMGWVLSPAMHGRGYATEAVSAGLSWADRRFATPRIACIIAPDNRPSLNVAAKSGFKELRRVVYKEHPTIVLAR